MHIIFPVSLSGKSKEAPLFDLIFLLRMFHVGKISILEIVLDFLLTENRFLIVKGSKYTLRFFPVGLIHNLHLPKDTFPQGLVFSNKKNAYPRKKEVFSTFSYLKKERKRVLNSIQSQHTFLTTFPTIRWNISCGTNDVYCLLVCHLLSIISWQTITQINNSDFDLLSFATSIHSCFHAREKIFLRNVKCSKTPLYWW